MRLTSDPYSPSGSSDRNRTVMRVTAAVRSEAQSNRNGDRDNRPVVGLPAIVESRRQNRKTPKPQTRSHAPLIAQLAFQANREFSLAREQRRRPERALGAYADAAKLKASRSPTPPGSVLTLADV